MPDFDLVVHVRSAAAAQGLGAGYLRVVATAAEVADVADMILLALPDATEVEASVVAGMIEPGRIRPGTVIVDLSTIAPEDAIRIGRRVRDAGGRPLDAPMSGGKQAAIDGTLALMVGGDAADLEAARIVLAAFATAIVHIGPLGSGQIAKACNQLVVMGTLEIVAEALTLAGSMSTDPGRVREAMLWMSAGSRILALAGQRMLADDFTPGGRLMFRKKDIATIRRMAADRQLELPGFEVAAAAVVGGIERGDGDLDHAVIVRGIRRADDGVTIARDGAGPLQAAPVVTFATEASSRHYRLPGRDWTLLLVSQNSPSRRMTLSLAAFPAGSVRGPHVHEVEDELVYVISGRGRLEADGGGGQLEPGVSFHVPAGLSHGAVNDGDEPLVLLCTFTLPVTPGSYDPSPTA